MRCLAPMRSQTASSALKQNLPFAVSLSNRYCPASIGLRQAQAERFFVIALMGRFTSLTARGATTSFPLGARSLILNSPNPS